MRTQRRVAMSFVLAAAVAGCTSTPPSGSPASPSASSGTTTPAGSTAAGQRTVWLCRPDRTPNPCTGDTASTSLADGGGRHIRRAAPLAHRRLDCFYVYPTVSRERTRNADLRVQKAERDVALAQASRFSDVCRMWAPMYRQRTLHSLTTLADNAPGSPANTVALASLRAAWRDYLAHDNHGRRVVFIGHSQGAAMLIRLLRADIDPVASLRRQTALAILLGGNVTISAGRLTGGSFHHLPLCSAAGETGCVIAYSSFPSEPPAFSFFGRPGLGVSSLSGESADPDTRVACVNPAAVGSHHKVPLHPYFPTALAGSGASTPWTDLPDTYAGQCRTDGRATWLEVTPIHHDDPRARLKEDLGAAWGYHVVDVNVALGDLVDDVAKLR